MFSKLISGCIRKRFKSTLNYIKYLIHKHVFSVEDILQTILQSFLWSNVEHWKWKHTRSSSLYWPWKSLRFCVNVLYIQSIIILWIWKQYYKLVEDSEKDFKTSVLQRGFLSKQLKSKKVVDRNTKYLHTYF